MARPLGKDTQDASVWTEVPPEWPGSFDIYQNPELAEIFAWHLRMEVADRDGLLTLVRRRLGLGTFRLFVGAPETVGGFETWAPRLTDYSTMEVRTNQRVAELEPHRISADDNYSLITDLSVGAEKLFGGFEKRCRNAIRGGARCGVVVRRVEQPSELKTFYELCARSSANGKRFWLPSFELLRDLLATRYGTLHLAIGDGQIIGGAAFLLSSSMIGFLCAFDRGFAHLKPNNLMHFEAMKWGIENGYGFYDMGDQSLALNPQLTAFKVSFNPTFVPAFHYRVPGSRWKTLLVEASARLVRPMRHVSGGSAA
jgi:hypothetical protein